MTQSLNQRLLARAVRASHVAIDSRQSGEHEIPKGKYKYGRHGAELFEQDAGNCRT